MQLIILAVVLVLSILPVKLGASVVGAKRAEWPMCFVALVVASVACGFAVHQLRLGSGSMAIVGIVLSVLLAGLVYMLVLGTTYPRGLAVSLIQWAGSALLVVVLASTVLGPTLHRALGHSAAWFR